MKLQWMFALICALLSGAAAAQVNVSSAWVRSTVTGQSATGAFMTLTAKDGARLVGASSAVAGVVEIHEMAMDGNVMKMRAVPALELPAGRAVELKPGGYHVMLMELRKPLAAGEKLRLELRFELPDKRLVTLPVDAEVAQRGPAMQGGHK